MAALPDEHLTTGEKDLLDTKNPDTVPTSQEVYYADEEAGYGLDAKKPTILNRILSAGVEINGIRPIEAEYRLVTQARDIGSLFFAANCGILPISVGYLGPLYYGTSLGQASAIIVVFNILCSIPPCYICTYGGQSGFRQMVLGRYSYGNIGIALAVCFNLMSMLGYCILNCILGGQTLAAVSSGNLSWTVGIVVVALIALFVSFMGFKVLHVYEKYSWIPSLLAVIIALGLSGSELKLQPPSAPLPVSYALSFGSVVAGGALSWSGNACDFTTYFSPANSRAKVFMYAYAGMVIPTTLLQIVGVAIAAAQNQTASWLTAADIGGVPYVLHEMLSRAKGFGGFVTVLLAVSVVGNTAATMYSVTLNLQILVPWLLRVPRWVFSIIASAIMVALAIVGAHRFDETLQDFLSIIAYWCTPYLVIIIEEHLVFRRNDFENYDRTAWNVTKRLPYGFAALFTTVASFGISVPGMDQTWFVGPIAAHTGDIGFELALGFAAIAYIPLRWLELRWRDDRVL